MMLQGKEAVKLHNYLNKILVQSHFSWQDNYNIIQDGIKKLNAQTRTKYEMKAIRLKFTLTIIDDILKCSSKI